MATAACSISSLAKSAGRDRQPGTNCVKCSPAACRWVRIPSPTAIWEKYGGFHILRPNKSYSNRNRTCKHNWALLSSNSAILQESHSTTRNRLYSKQSWHYWSKTATLEPLQIHLQWA